MVQSRRFTVTLFNHDEKPEFFEEFQYMCCQQETCPDTGKIHWQMYLEMRSKISPTSKKKGEGLANLLAKLWDVPAVHTEVAQYPEAARRYTQSNEKGSAVEGTWFEAGKRLRSQADPQDIAEAVLGGQSPLEIVQANPANLMYLRNAQALAALMPPPFVSRDVHVYFLWGVSGGGKSHRAREIMASKGEALCVPCGYERGFFSGPIGSRNCVYLEDLSPDEIPHTTLLRLCDKWVTQLNVKNGATYCVCTTVIITSNYHPAMFDKAPAYPFRRRMEEFGTVEHFDTVYHK